MPYTAEISRTNPSCFLFVLDQSASMSEPFADQSGRKKAACVAETINRLLYSLVVRCVRGSGVLDYFHIGVIGYGRDVAPALGGPLAGRSLVSVTDIANHPLRVECQRQRLDDGAGGLVERTLRVPIWVEPVAGGATPMCAALELAARQLADFLVRYPHCYPPVVVHVTDGEASDGDPEPRAAAVRGLASEDGNALLFNMHLSSSPAPPVEFPGEEAGLPDGFARALFRMSSPLPPPMRRVAGDSGVALHAAARGFVFNGDLVSLIRFLDIGTRVDARNLR